MGRIFAGQGERFALLSLKLLILLCLPFVWQLIMFLHGAMRVEEERSLLRLARRQNGDDDSLMIAWDQFTVGKFAYSLKGADIESMVSSAAATSASVEWFERVFFLTKRPNKSIAHHWKDQTKIPLNIQAGQLDDAGHKISITHCKLTNRA